MKTSGTGRVLAAVLVGIVFGIYRHYTQIVMLQKGRDAYLAAQSRHFDSVANDHSSFSMIIAGVILSALAFGVYELVAAGFTRLIPPSQIEE